MACGGLTLVNIGRVRTGLSWDRAISLAGVRRLVRIDRLEAVRCDERGDNLAHMGMAATEVQGYFPTRERRDFAEPHDGGVANLGVEVLAPGDVSDDTLEGVQCCVWA